MTDDHAKSGEGETEARKRASDEKASEGHVGDSGVSNLAILKRAARSEAPAISERNSANWFRQLFSRALNWRRLMAVSASLFAFVAAVLGLLIGWCGMQPPDPASISLEAWRLSGTIPLPIQFAVALENDTSTEMSQVELMIESNDTNQVLRINHVLGDDPRLDAEDYYHNVENKRDLRLTIDTLKIGQSAELQASARLPLAGTLRVEANNLGTADGTFECPALNENTAVPCPIQFAETDLHICKLIYTLTSPFL